MRDRIDGHIARRREEAVGARIFVGVKWFVLLGLVVLPGCSDGLAAVSGTVTVDGQPVTGGPQTYATVSFYRADGVGSPAIGIIDGSGRYSLKTGAAGRLEPANYLVAIAVKQILPPPSPDEMPQAKLLTPVHYSSPTKSGLTAEVQPGRNTIDFSLETKGKL